MTGRGVPTKHRGAPMLISTTVLRQFVKLLPGIVGYNFTGSRTIKVVVYPSPQKGEES